MSTMIPLSRIRRMKPCGYENDTADYAVLTEHYPDGVPLTAKAALDIQEKGGDVLWGIVRLMDKPRRQQFILYTLRQRQPHLVTIFEKAGLGEHAKAIKWLRFRTIEDAGAAIDLLEDARAAARDARDAVWDARDAATEEQIRYGMRLLIAQHRNGGSP